MANNKTAKKVTKNSPKNGKKVAKTEVKPKFKKIKLNKTEKKSIAKEFSGEVVSNKSDKTITVLISTVKVHPLYKKRYRSDKKYQVHDPENKFNNGDTVRFVPTKPYSKSKKWHVIY